MFAERSPVIRVLCVMAIGLAAIFIATRRPAANRARVRVVDDRWAEIRAREAEIRALEAHLEELDREIVRLQPCSIGERDAAARERHGRREADLLRATRSR